jgi:hypothetical protein
VAFAGFDATRAILGHREAGTLVGAARENGRQDRTIDHVEISCRAEICNFVRYPDNLGITL